ncbi:MAG: 2-oxoacid:acceptor oxidoreductase subunit alpha, partial [Syntrophales bacterium]
MQGNQAIAEGAFYAGARFYAGYPITPSSEIAEECSKRMPSAGGVYLQMEDEIASMAAIIGASLAGAKSFTATSGPGFSLMQENLGLAVMGEVPCVVVNVQRSGPSTGLATKPAQSDVMQLRWGRHGDQTVIALCPATVGECFSLTVTAFNLAEKFRVPVILAPDEVVGHLRENVVIPEPGELVVIDRKRPTVPPEIYKPFTADADGVAPLAPYGSDYITHVSSSMHGPDGYSNNDPANAAWRVAQLHRKIEMHREEIILTKSFAAEDAEVLLIAFGVTTRASRAAALELRSEGVRAGVLQLLTL